MKFIMKFIFITYYTFIFSLFYCITHSTYLTNTSTTVGIFFYLLEIHPILSLFHKKNKSSSEIETRYFYMSLPLGIEPRIFELTARRFDQLSHRRILERRGPTSRDSCSSIPFPAVFNEVALPRDPCRFRL